MKPLCLSAVLATLLAGASTASAQPFPDDPFRESPSKAKQVKPGGRWFAVGAQSGGFAVVNPQFDAAGDPIPDAFEITFPATSGIRPATQPLRSRCSLRSPQNPS